MWKQKQKIFSHEFGGIKEVFFVGKYYKQRVARKNSLMPLIYEVISMHIMNFRLVELYVRPIRQLLYDFMWLPLGPLSDSRRFTVTYEFKDTNPESTWCLRNIQCLPFPIAGDMMLVRARCGGPHNMATIKRVYENKSMRCIRWQQTWSFARRWRSSWHYGRKPPSTTTWELQIPSFLASKFNIMPAFPITKLWALNLHPNAS